MVVVEEELEKIGYDAERAVKDKSAGGDTFYKGLLWHSDAHYKGLDAARITATQLCSKEHEESMAFRSKLFSGAKDGALCHLVEWNKGPRMVGASSKTLILLDATGSMAHLLQNALAVIKETFDRIYTILDGAGNGSTFEVMVATYRNYDAGVDYVLETSGWCQQPHGAYDFLRRQQVRGGLGPEAIEVGLQYAAKQEGLKQVILMGDAPANDPAKIPAYRRVYGIPENHPLIGPPTTADCELGKLHSKGVAVHAFSLAARANTNFEQMAAETGGKFNTLDVNAADSAERLTDFWSETVLRDVGGEGLVEQYKRKYVASYAGK
eukprot:TRINITY_DN8638_c0_g2_i1.p2 TRINITY_DN8638_c0_g2~~TRINITY_DN8638_c0_g2_i1.p2  ORF type:complete len:323 (+),score=130.16 TRINITY_DN8638_c0_g2_i1:2-970(+)